MKKLQFFDFIGYLIFNIFSNKIFQNNLVEKGVLKNYQSIYIKMAPSVKSISGIDMENIKKSKN